MDQQGRFKTFQDNATNYNIDNISAGLSLAVLVAMGTIGNIVLLISVGSVMRTVKPRWQRLVHDLVFMYGCLEVIFFFIPCILSTYAYLNSWRVDMHQSVCDFFGWVVFTVKFGSLWIMTMIAIERYLVVCRPSGLSNKIACRMGYTAFVGIITVTLVAAVPLIVKAGMVTSIAVPNAICHFDFTPKTLNTQAFVITCIVLAYVMFQVTLFCHVSILCHPSRDVRKNKSPIQNGAAGQHGNHTMIYALTPLTLWMWVCTLPLLITLIMAQTGYEVGTGLEFGVLRTLTVCSALSPYILLSSSVYYRQSLYAFICCRGAWTSETRVDEQNNDVSSVVRCENCLAHITRLQEQGHRSPTTTIVESRETINPGSANHIVQDRNCTSHQREDAEVASNGHSDWPEVEVESHTYQIPELDYDVGDESTLACTRGMLPSDSRVYLLSAGENGELVCGGSYNGGSFQGGSEYTSLRGDQETNSSFPIVDEYDEEEYYQSETGQAGGYLITLPVNMPGQGSNETVERIFYIQEPHKRGLQPTEGDNLIQDEDLQVAVTKDTTARVESSDVTSPIYDTTHSSSLSHVVTHEDDIGSDEELEDEELSKVEAEIRGRIMGRSYFGKLRRSSAPQTMAVQNQRVQISSDAMSMDTTSWTSNQDSPCLSRQGIREQDIRLHGPSASDPRLLTLAFQQAMLAHSQQYVTDSNNEIDLKDRDPNGIIHRNSMGQIIPVINITPVENFDAMDEIQPIFAQNNRRLDYRFLAPIAEEVCIVSDRSSTRKHNLSSMLNTKHEKVHRMPKSTSQLMSNWKLQEDVRRSISSTPLIRQNEIQEATEPPRDDDITAIRQTGSDEHRRCPSALEGRSVNSGIKLHTTNDTTDKSSTSVSHLSLEQVGNIIEGTVDGKERAADPLLETSEWINVEHAMQGNVNLGFVAEEDVSLNSNGLQGKDISSQTTIKRQKRTSQEPSIESCDSVLDANVDPVEGGKTKDESMLNMASGIAIDSSRLSGSVATAKEGDIDVKSLKKVSPLKRQEKVNDSMNSPPIIGSPTNIFSIQSTNNKPTNHNENVTMDKENEAFKVENLGKTDIVSDGGNPKCTHLIENEIGPNNSRATVELMTSHLKGKRPEMNAHPLTRMRAFPIDGNLYVMYRNKKRKYSNSNMTSEKNEESRGCESTMKTRNMSSLRNGSDSTVEPLDRRASFPIQKRVKFMNIVPKREKPHVEIAIV